MDREGIEVGKLSTEQFNKWNHDEQHTVFLLGIQETQRMVSDLKNMIKDQQKEYVTKSWLKSRVAYGFGAGLIAGLWLFIKKIF